MRRKKNKNSVQELIGIKGFGAYGLRAGSSELVYYHIAPTNISVLSPEHIFRKIQQLQQLLAALPELGFLCLDACERFDENKLRIHALLETEQNPAVRDVLEKDLAHLDGIQIEMSTARQFLLVASFTGEKDENIFYQATRMEKLIAGQGFEARRLDRAGLKRLLALYFGVSKQGESLDDQGFFDRVLPTTIKFLPDYYHCGDAYGSAWAIREYPPSTEEQALFARLAERAGVTLRAYNRAVELPDQRKMLQNTTRRNRVAARASDAQESVNAEENLQDIANLLANMRRNREPLLYATVFVGLRADSLEDLRNLQQDIAMELNRSKVTADKLTLRQKEGFLSALPTGDNRFDATQFERPLPASSIANLYPFSYSGKNDPEGFYLGRDAFDRCALMGSTGLDAHKNLLAVQVFAAQIQNIPGADMNKMTDWLDHAWDMGDGNSESYRQYLREFGDAFERIEQSYPGVAAAMFNCEASYLPSEMLAAADWVSNGASPEEVLEACIAQHELSGIHHRHTLWREDRPDGTRADFTGRALKNLDFTGMDFHEAVFTDARLENCWMNETDFSLSDFSGAVFLDISAIGADFGSADFDGSSLVRSDFRDAYLGGAGFIGATLDACDFTGADMETADFSRAEIQNCRGLEGQSAGPAMAMQ